jgi:predicted RNA binding protein YcfA (HicA-like mRNA interferase family)
VKRRDLEKHLRENGCSFIGEGSRHAKWRGPEGHAATVPRHREIRAGTARAICKQLRIPTPTTLT